MKLACPEIQMRSAIRWWEKTAGFSWSSDWSASRWLIWGSDSRLTGLGVAAGFCGSEACGASGRTAHDACADRQRRKSDSQRRIKPPRRNGEPRKRLIDRTVTNVTGI